MSHGHLVFHIDVTNGATVLVSVGSSLEVADLELEELHQAAKIRQHTPDVQRLFDQHGFSLNSLGRELKNALERAAPQGSEAFEKLRRLWRKTKKKLAILEASTPTRAGPRAFVDQVGSNAALVSWEVLEHLTEGFWPAKSDWCTDVYCKVYICSWFLSSEVMPNPRHPHDMSFFWCEGDTPDIPITSQTPAVTSRHRPFPRFL